MKILGAFYCPHCKEQNLCSCETCKSFYEKNGIGEMKYCIYTDDGEGYICAYCDKPFGPDESLETEINLKYPSGYLNERNIPLFDLPQIDNNL